MANFVTVKRVTIVVDNIYQKQVLEWISALGAKGYSLWECQGKGGHVLLDDHWFFGAGRVRIETLVQPDVAAKILEALDEHRHLPLTVCQESVEVLNAEKF